MSKLRDMLILCSALIFSVSIFAAPVATKVMTKQKVVTTKVVKAKKVDSVVNINKADIKTLSSVKGINYRCAKAIIKYRNKHGAFKSINDLKKVKCKKCHFGKKKIKKLSNRVTV
ncbi:MAG: helix-hairpin-helix domain-containing protein [Gammaproteobacteria bacterium]|nr:helix-hairpin-helix domain-containing protein [Gammaproteobacteria bacterium]